MPYAKTIFDEEGLSEATTASDAPPLGALLRVAPEWMNGCGGFAFLIEQLNKCFVCAESWSLGHVGGHHTDLPITARTHID